MTTKYGIFDTVDQLWLGDESGPKLFDEEWIANAASQVAAVRVGVTLNRYQARVWVPAEVRHRDSVDTKMGTLEALVRLEEGRA